MRVSVIFTCLVLAVCVQAQRYYNTESIDYTSTSRYNNYNRERYPTAAPQRNTYEATDQYNAQSAPVNQRCVEKNERYPVPGSCDRYIECLNGTAEEKLCPDGLRFNPNVRFNLDPCQYPIEVECLARASLQPPQPTEDCPNQFGYFKIGDAKNCSGFRNCVHGVGFDFKCPEGLAFNMETYRCDWPDEVEDCDVEAFLGFRCPEVPELKDVGPPAGFRTYRSPSDCQKYFICINGKPRRLSCGGYAAFDELTNSCVAADEISECPAELRSKAAESREAELQRQAAQDAYLKQKSGKPQISSYTTTVVPASYQKQRYGQFQSYITTDEPDATPYVPYGRYGKTSSI